MKEEINVPTATLSPPWYTLQKQIAAVLTSPHVTVGQLVTTQFPYVVPIKADDQTIATAIASILPKTYSFGNVLVAPSVTFNGKPVTPIVPASTDELVNLVKKAFQDNPLLAQVVVHPLTPMGGAGIVFPIFLAQVVQFFNDDLSDCYQNFNEVLSKCARMVLAPAPGGIPMGPSTALIRTGTPQEERELAKAKA